MYLHIFSEMASSKNSEARAAHVGEGRHRGMTGGLKLCLNLCHSPLTPVTPAQEVQQQHRQQWPGSGGSAVQFIFIGPVILGLILITPVLLP